MGISPTQHLRLVLLVVGARIELASRDGSLISHTELITSLLYLPYNTLWPLRVIKGYQRPTDCRCPPSCVCLVLTCLVTWPGACPKQRLGSQDRIRTCTIGYYFIHQSSLSRTVYHSATWLCRARFCFISDLLADNWICSQNRIWTCMRWGVNLTISYASLAHFYGLIPSRASLA